MWAGKASVFGPFGLFSEERKQNIWGWFVPPREEEGKSLFFLCRGLHLAKADQGLAGGGGKAWETQDHFPTGWL